MRKVREVLRLKHTLGMSYRQISEATGVGKTVVGEYVRRAGVIGISWPVPEAIDDAELDRRLFPVPGDETAGPRAAIDWRKVHAEMKRPSVTLVLLWQEYRAEQAGGYGYSRFCDLYGAWRKTISATMRQTHPAGEKLFVDYAGDTVPVFDQTTDAVRPAHIFVAALGASNYTYAEARWSEGLADWIGAHVNTLTTIGGVPKAVVCDNLKAGVTKPSRYEPGINRSYQDLAEHYGFAVLPTRVRKPRDKTSASYCTSYRWCRGDGNEPSGSTATAAVALAHGCARWDLPQATIQAVSIALVDESLAAPLVHGGLGDAELRGHLAGREHAAPAQPIVPAREPVGVTDPSDLLQVERVALPCAPFIPVENLSDLSIAVMIEKTVHLSNELRLELADLSDRQRPLEVQSARGTARQPHVSGDLLRLDQCHVVDEQANDALALADVDTRILPEPRQLLGKVENASASLRTESFGLLFAAALVLFRRIGVPAQFVVPIRFERICDEAVIGIDLHVSPPRKLGLVAHSFDMLAPRGICLASPRLKLALDFQSDSQRHRRCHLDHQRGNRRIDDLAGHRLAGLAGTAHRAFLTDIGRDRVAVLATVTHTHAFAAQAT
jgi:transposase